MDLTPPAVDAEFDKQLQTWFEHMNLGNSVTAILSANGGLDTSSLPKRFLSPGSLSLLHLEFQQQLVRTQGEDCAKDHAASFWSFCHRFNTKWKRILEFQTGSEKGSCTFCHECKLALRKRDR